MTDAPRTPSLVVCHGHRAERAATDRNVARTLVHERAERTFPGVAFAGDG